MSNNDNQASTRPPKKQRVTMYLDALILQAFRAQAAHRGAGYQTLINDSLRTTLAGDNAPLTVNALRQVLREELGECCPQSHRTKNPTASDR